jgi:hypothetical protein
MSNGHLLIAEVHQQVVTSLVEAVYPALEQAETMIAKMNHHLPAFVYSYLMDKGLNEEFVINLVKKLLLSYAGYGNSKLRMGWQYHGCSYAGQQ